MRDQSLTVWKVLQVGIHLFSVFHLVSTMSSFPRLLSKTLSLDFFFTYLDDCLSPLSILIMNSLLHASVYILEHPTVKFVARTSLPSY